MFYNYTFDKRYVYLFLKMHMTLPEIEQYRPKATLS